MVETQDGAGRLAEPLAVNGRSAESLPDGPKQSHCELLETAAFVAAIAFLLFDIGWILNMPVLFLLGGVPGILLQAWCSWHSLRHHQGFEVHMQFAFFLWILGNFFWAGSELVWSDDGPIGLFKDLSFTRDLDEAWNQPTMVASTAVVGLSGVWLAIAFFSVQSQLKKRRARALAVAEARNSGPPVAPLLADPRHSGVVAAPVPPDARPRGANGFYAAEPEAVPSLAHTMEEEQMLRRHFYLVFFMVADFAWCLGNLLQVGTVSNGVLILLAAVMVLCGIPAVAFGIRAVRDDLKVGMNSNTAMLAADVVWVTANVLWGCQDLLDDMLVKWFSHLMFNASLACFGICAVGMLTSLCFKNEDGEQVHMAGALSVVSFSRISVGQNHTTSDLTATSPPEPQGQLASIDEATATATPHDEAAPEQPPTTAAVTEEPTAAGEP